MWFQVFGGDAKMQVRLKQWAFTAVVYTCHVLLMALSWHWGATSAAQFTLVAGLSLAGEGLFYVLIRSGRTARGADPSLTQLQIHFAVWMSAICYSSAGPYRTAMLFTMLLNLTFGAFALSGAAMLRHTLAALVVVPVVVLTSTGTAPSRLDLFNYAALLVVLPGISILSVRLSRLRSRLREQKAELAMALKRIEALAMRDELTGLMNRRCIHEAILAAQANVKRNATPACVAIVDIDSLQAHQRHLGARRRRSGSEGFRPNAAGKPAHQRPGGAMGRRRV